MGSTLLPTTGQIKLWKISMLGGKGKERTSLFWGRVRLSPFPFIDPASSLLPKLTSSSSLLHDSMEYYSDSLWKIWQSRPDDRKFSLVCIVRESSVFLSLSSSTTRVSRTRFFLPHRQLWRLRLGREVLWRLGKNRFAQDHAYLASVRPVLFLPSFFSSKPLELTFSFSHPQRLSRRVRKPRRLVRRTSSSSPRLLQRPHPRSHPHPPHRATSRLQRSREAYGRVHLLPRAGRARRAAS